MSNKAHRVVIQRFRIVLFKDSGHDARTKVCRGDHDETEELKPQLTENGLRDTFINRRDLTLSRMERILSRPS